MPEPSHLILLENLHSTAVGTKVRFLGCVHAYDIAAATVFLRMHYPATAQDTPTAAVGVQNVLETLERRLLEVGAWVNVLGHVRGEEKGSRETGERVTRVDASMVWTAGAIKVDDYEVAAKAYLDDIAVVERE